MPYIPPLVYTQVLEQVSPNPREVKRDKALGHPDRNRSNDFLPSTQTTVYTGFACNSELQPPSKWLNCHSLKRKGSKCVARSLKIFYYPSLEPNAVHLLLIYTLSCVFYRRSLACGTKGKC